MQFYCPYCSQKITTFGRFISKEMRCCGCKKLLFVYNGKDGFVVSEDEGTPWKNAEGFTDSTARLAMRW